jgi:hypothetical protein
LDFSTWSKIRKKQPLCFDRNIVLVHGGPELSVRRLLGRVYAAHLHLRRLSRLDGAHVARQHEPGVNALKLFLFAADYWFVYQAGIFGTRSFHQLAIFRVPKNLFG